MPNITFANENKTISVENDTTILDAARRIGVTIESPCAGLGTCGKCKVKIGSTTVLACQTRVNEDITVFTESKTEENKTLKILSSGQSFSYSLKPYVTKRLDVDKTIIYGGNSILGTEDGDTTNEVYGLVVDIGTTTLVAEIVDLRNGERIASTSQLNPQSAYAQDVLSRIHFAGNKEGLDTLQKALIDALNEMLCQMTEQSGIQAKRIYEVIYSGNTAMLHLACGVDPKPLGQYPYVSQIQGGQHVSGLGLNISPFGIIYLPPIISAFVGPDITSGVLISQLHKQTDTVLFIDIGTNGEMALAKDGTLAATSTAAGPAFEGMNISCGMRAGNGAIESFKINESSDFSYQTIGNAEATGICGSGLLDITGELVANGIVSKNGRFSADAKLGMAEGKKAFYITDTVYLSQNDVRQIQLAKGAIRSGIEAMLSKLNLTAVDVDRVLIAGSFGYHLNEKSLLNIGLLPSEFEGRISFVGNTAQTGGVAFLLNTDFREEMAQLVSEIQKIELANDENFEKLFVASLRF